MSGAADGRPEWRRPLWRLAILLPLPALVLAAGVAYDLARGPDWLATNQDPSYVYLVNALTIDRVEAPRHLDHPGTTVQVAGALLIPLLYASFGSESTLEEDVLRQPEFYLRALTWVLITAYAVALYACGGVAWHVTGRAVVAWLVQASPFLSLRAFEELADFKAEPALLALAAVLAALVLRTLGPSVSSPASLAVALGICSGLAVATKFTGISILAASLVVLPGWRARGRCLAAFALTALIAMGPAIGGLPDHARFLVRIVSGQGLYGLNMHPDQVHYWSRLSVVVREEAVFFLSVVVAGLAWAVTSRADRDRPDTSRVAVRRALLAVLVACAGQVALLLKQPYQSRYLIPATGLVGLVLALVGLLALWDESGRLRPAAAVVFGACLLGAAAWQGGRLRGELSRLRQVSVEQIQARAVAESLPDCRIVNYYRSSSPSQALMNTVPYAPRSLVAAMGRLHPNALFIDAHSPGLFSFTERWPAQEVAARVPCLVFQGSPAGPTRPFSPFEEFDRAGFPVSGALDVLSVNDWEGIFRAGRSRVRHPPWSAPFAGWRAIDGMGDVEGPYPQWNMPVVRWGTGKSTRLTFLGTGDTVSLFAECATWVAGQTMEVQVDGRPAGRFALKSDGGFQTVRVDFETRPGENQITLAYGGTLDRDGRSLAVLFSRLQIWPAGDRLGSNALPTAGAR